MKNYILLFTIAFVLICCTKDAEVNDVLQNLKLNQSEVFADGQSTISISVELSNKSSTDRRNVIFSASGGVFTGSGSNKHTVKAEYENGILTAKTTLRVSTQPGTIKISVQPEFDSPIKEFILTDSAIAKVSQPFSIKLEPSSLGIASNSLTEVQLTGNLKNSSGKFVSKGSMVLFEDFVTGGPANGNFRSIQNMTTDSSKVSATYGAGTYPIGTLIKIRATVLDGSGLATNIKDSILLTINQ